MGKAFNAAAAAAESPRVITVPCEAWGADVRLQRMEPLAKLELIAPYEAAEKDASGSIKDRQKAWEFGVALIAASVVNDDGSRQFETPELLQWLGGEFEAVSQLLPHAMTLQRLGSADLDTAKKN
jgi:hypothetical protein